MGASLAVSNAGVAAPLYQGTPGVEPYVYDTAAKLAGIAVGDPGAVTTALEAVSLTMLPSQQMALADALAHDLSDAQLGTLSRTPAGRTLLDTLDSYMTGGVLDSAHQAQVDRVRGARLANTNSPEDRADLMLRAAMQPGPLDAAKLGQGLADELLKNTATGAQIIDRILDSALPSHRLDIARNVTRQLSDAKLKELAASPEGKALLTRLSSQMQLPYMNEPQQQRVQKVLTEQESVDAARSKLAKADGFSALAPATRDALLDAAGRHPNDKDFQKELRKLVADAAFRGLGARGANVVASLVKYTETSSYAQVPDRLSGEALDFMGKLATYAEGPGAGNTVLRNSLDQLASGNVKLKIVHSDEEFAGMARGRSVTINTKQEGLMNDRAAIATTAVHEVNHVRNGPSAAGTVENFLDEYRAYYVEWSLADKGKPSVDHMTEVMDKLTLDDSREYQPLVNLARQRGEFRDLVDKIYKGLESKPPKILTPEELRQKLLALPGMKDNTYLNKPSNLDNH